MRLRSDPHIDAALAMTTWQMARRLPATIGEAFRLGWTVDRRAVSWLLACQAASAGFAALALAATSTTFTHLFSDGDLGTRIHAALLPALLVGAGLVSFKLAEAGGEASVARLAPKVTREADLKVLHAATAVELEAYESPGYEDALEAAGRGAEETRELLIHTQQLIAALAQLVAASSVAAVLHPILLPLLVLAAAPRGVAAVRAARIEHAAAHRMLSDTRLRSVLRSYTIDRRHAAEIRAGTMADFLTTRYQDVAARLEREHLNANLHALRTRLTGDTMSGLALMGTWGVLAALALTGRIDLAIAGTAVIAVRASSTALTGLVHASAALFRTALFIDDWRRYLTSTVGLRVKRGHRQPAADGPQTISTSALTYTYPSTDSPAVANVNLQLRRGEIVALVGENGSGKTTLAKLLMGLLLPSSGQVRWDNCDLTEADTEPIWRKIGMVPQDYTRWPMTARENITLGQPQITGDSAVYQAAEAAGAAPVIEGLPHRLDTLLARSWWGGHELSGGQWQRIAIARAFHRDAPVVILDEPTSALDPRAEHHVFTRMRALAQGRIALFVTHRLTNVRVADRILVLNQGRVVEDGGFDDLLYAGGLFAELYKLQQDQ